MESRVIKFRYVCVKPTPFVFSRIFTMEELERGDVDNWKTINGCSAGVVHRNLFTGLQDKNGKGKDVYEGDIFFNGKENGVVRFVTEGHWEVLFKEYSLYLYNFLKYDPTRESIGNIYENKDLLNL